MKSHEIFMKCVEELLQKNGHDLEAVRVAAESQLKEEREAREAQREGRDHRNGDERDTFHTYSTISYDLVYYIIYYMLYIILYYIMLNMIYDMLFVIIEMKGSLEFLVVEAGLRQTRSGLKEEAQELQHGLAALKAQVKERH